MDRRVAAIAVAIAVTMPGQAAAATKHYAGKNDQGKRATAKVVDGKLVKLVTGRWLGTCEDRGFRWGPVLTTWSDRPVNPIEQDGTSFSDSGTLEEQLDNGHKVVTTQTLTGRLLSGGRIKATQRSEGKFYNAKGKLYDTCRVTLTIRLKRR